MHRFLDKRERLALVAALVVIVLLAAVVNVPFAVTRIRSRTAPQPPIAVDLRGPAAAPSGWPVRPPHDFAWPDPNYRVENHAFGFREFHVTAPGATEGAGRFSLQAQHLGWPLPVIEIRQFWWDWNDPALEGPESDPRPSLLPLGLVANPILVGVPVWIVVAVLPAGAIALRRWARAWAGRCQRCGYSLTGVSECPECGPEPRAAS